MQLNSHIDRTVLRDMAKNSSNNAESIGSVFLMHSLMTLSTLLYEDKESLVKEIHGYPLLAHYAQIGLIYRGHYEYPQIFKQLLVNISESDPYKLGGAILGMALQ